MPAFNKVFLMGNLTRDPQLKFLPSQTALCEFALAVNRKYRTAAGEEKEEVTFVDCASFGKQGEVINQYFTKGKPIFIEGRLKYDSWDDKNGGGKRSRITVVVEHFEFVGGDGRRQEAADGGGYGSEDDRAGGVEKPTTRPGRAERQSRGSSQRPSAEQPFGEEKQFEEADIPF